MDIVLASSSPYRRKLLEPLIPTLKCIAPDINESIQSNESATEYVRRLSFEKAKVIACQQQNALIIGSDQCAELEGKIVTKPNSPDDAYAQLSAASGKFVKFYTGLCLFNATKNSHQLACETYQVKFRTLSDKQINAYLHKDQPYDCAGSFKAEGLGIMLFESMHGDDPNTLIGLPIISLISMLHKEGVDLLT